MFVNIFKLYATDNYRIKYVRNVILYFSTNIINQCLLEYNIYGMNIQKPKLCKDHSMSHYRIMRKASNNLGIHKINSILTK